MAVAILNSFFKLFTGWLLVQFQVSNSAAFVISSPLILSRQAASTSSVGALFSNPRNVCLLHNYEAIRGPYFHALFDQLIEQIGMTDDTRVMFCHSGKFNDDILGSSNDSNSTTQQRQHKRSQQLKEDLDLQSFRTIALQDYNPRSLAEAINDYDPNVIWVGSSQENSFLLRYVMRTSGLDGIVHQLCGPIGQGEDSPTVLYVGEGSGAICGGADMVIGHSVGDDSQTAPEPQFRGLELLGPKQSIFFGDVTSLKAHPRIKASPDDLMGDVAVLSINHAFVWAQNDGQVTSFAMNFDRRGMIEKLSSPEPLPPLVAISANAEGRSCIGEPSVDPSRSMQVISDSEWMEDWN